MEAADRNHQFTYQPSGAFSLAAARVSLQRFPSGARPTRGIAPTAMPSCWRS